MYNTKTGKIKKRITTYATGISLLLVEYSANFCAKNIGTFFKGHQKTMPEILKRRCVNATVTAAILPVINAASIAVTVVPMLAPSVYGKI